METHKREIIGMETSLRAVYRILQRVARTDSTVLVTGESGTGKELAVRYLHEQSRRASGPLVVVNCGAIPHELLESELFGYEKGAFTGAVHSRRGRFEMACGGTVFLDEVGEMDPLLQVKLLRVLQEHEIEPVGGTGPRQVDVRVVAATNRNLEAEVAEGRFREDLFYRLNVIPVQLPPLRERGSDVLLLAQAFLERFCQERGRPVLRLSEEVRRIFMAYPWPGNVRELENFMERLSILADGDTIVLDDLSAKILSHPAVQELTAEMPCAGEPKEIPVPRSGECSSGFIWPTLADLDRLGLGMKDFVETCENRLLDEALAESGGVRSRAASRLGIKRTTLIERLRRRGEKDEPAR